MSAPNLSVTKTLWYWSHDANANDVNFQMTPNMNINSSDHFDFSKISFDFEILTDETWEGGVMRR